MRYPGAPHDDGVFDFHGGADVAAVPDGRGRADIAVRPDFAVLPDDDRPDDVGARPHRCALTDDHVSLEHDIGLHLAEVLRHETGQHGLIGPQQVPGIREVEPGLYLLVMQPVGGVHQHLEGIGYFVLAPRRLLRPRDGVEYLRREEVKPGIGHEGRGLFRLFVDIDDPVLGKLDHPQAARVFHLDDAHGVMAAFGQSFDVLAADDDVAVDDQEVAVHHARHHPDGVRRAQLLALLGVGDAYPPFLPFPEVAPHLGIAVADDEDELPDAGLPGLYQQVLHDGLVSDGQHHLGAVAGEGTHPVAFAGG